MNAVEHYNRLIDENNDPFRDPLPMQAYMDKWDGQRFIESMYLSDEKTVLEIGVGTGRLAAKVVPRCGKFFGIDLSPNTIDRTTENLSNFANVELICVDFLGYTFGQKFDIIYSSLTLMHIEDKQGFITKVAGLLKENGRFCLSIDKEQSDWIDMGEYRVKIYPDRPEEITACIARTGMMISNQFETEFAHVFVCTKL